MKKSIIIMLSMSLFLTCDVNANFLKHAKKEENKAKKNVSQSAKSSSSAANQALTSADAKQVYESTQWVGTNDAVEAGTLDANIKKGNDYYDKGDYHDAMGRYIDAIVSEYILGGATPAWQPTKDDLWDRIQKCLNNDSSIVIDLPVSITSHAYRAGTYAAHTRDVMRKKAASICYSLGMTRLNQKDSNGSPMHAVKDYATYFTTAHTLDDSTVYPDIVQDYVDSLPAS